MKILFAYADQPGEWNCSEHRCMVPSRAINRLPGHFADVVFIGDLVSELPSALIKAENADIIIYQRNVLYRALIDAEKWRCKGKTVLVDLDDGYHVMPASIASYDFWINGNVHVEGKKKQMQISPLIQLEHACKWMDGVTTPSKMIQLDWQNKYASRTYFVNNYLEEDNYRKARVPRPIHKDYLTIGWGGSHTHVESFMESGVVAALRRVLEKKDVKLIIAGGNLPLVHKMQLPESKVIKSIWVPYKEWPRTMATFDIGIAPLAGQYDRRRSWLKAAEYSITGIPWIATDADPYQALGNFGTLVRNKTAAWEEALINVIDNYQEYICKAEANVESALDMISIDRNVGVIVDIYQKAIENSSRCRPF